MHVFLHGIRQAFLRPVGACFGLLLQQEECAAAEHNLRKEGGLLPWSGEEEDELLPVSGEDDAEQSLQPKAKGHKIDEGREPSHENQQEVDSLVEEANDVRAHNVGQDEEQEGILPPVRGDQNAENHLCQDEARGVNQQEADLITKNGKFQPTNARKHDGGKFQPANFNEDDDSALRPTIGATYNGELFPYLADYLHVDVLHDSKQLLFTYMHAELGSLSMALMVHDDFVIEYAMPRVDPKVKKKTSLLLCLTIHTPFHPGEHGHDGYPPSSRTMLLSLNIEILHPPPHPLSTIPSTPALSNNISLFDADHEKLNQAASRTILLSLIPLRGRMDCQGHEIEFKEKTKRTMIEKGLLYINKDLLDPG